MGILILCKYEKVILYFGVVYFIFSKLFRATYTATEIKKITVQREYVNVLRS